MSRLVVFNETFASLNRNDDFTILWHEAIAGRQAWNVASAFIKCIVASGASHVMFWADNCGAQNKNWILFTALAWCVQQTWGPETVTIAYLERGHTTNRCDSIHGNIATAMKRQRHVTDFMDFVELCANSTKKIECILMNPCDFYKFESGQRSRQSKNVKLPQLNQVRELKFQKGCRGFFYRAELDDHEECYVDFLKPSFKLENEPKKMESPRGISQAKKDGILKLVPAIKARFWMDLPTNDSSNDLVSEFE